MEEEVEICNYKKYLYGGGGGELVVFPAGTCLIQKWNIQDRWFAYV